MINKKRLVKLTQKLIQAPSENPPGNEQGVARVVVDELKTIGLKSKIIEFAKNRANVICDLGNKNSKNSLLISPHLDTVPVGRNWKFSPFVGEISKNRLYGRGATDCKGNTAIALEAIRSLKEDGARLNYHLIFAATADEESGSKYGIIPLLKKRIIKPNAAVILDADKFNIMVAQKGLIHFKVLVSGKKAHGAYPWKGINAIDIAVELINKLKKLKFKFRKHQLLRPPTINIGTIRGGDKVNMVSDWCEFEVDLRFTPGMKPDQILSRIKNLFKNTTKRFKIEIQNIQAPYSVDKNHALVSKLAKSIKKYRVKSKLKGCEGATVITFFNKICPAIAFGIATPGQSHINDEHVLINDLYKGTLILEHFLKSY